MNRFSTDISKPGRSSVVRMLDDFSVNFICCGVATYKHTLSLQIDNPILLNAILAIQPMFSHKIASSVFRAR